MPRSVRSLLIAAGVLVAVVAVVAIALFVPATRSGLLGLGLRTVVASTGYHLVHARITYADQRLVIGELLIDDDRGEAFFSARSVLVSLDPAGLIGRSDRAWGLRSLELIEPRLSLRHRSDGTWNFAALLPSHRASPPRAPAPVPAPAHRWLTRVAIERGDIDVLDAQSPVTAGKRISLAAIQGDVTIAQFATSKGALRATLQTDRGSAPVQAEYFEDDPLGFARATLASANLPIAPLVDAFVPTPAFIIEGGVAPIHLMAYAIGYPPGTAPTWHLAGDAAIAHARLHVTPLVVMIRDVHCAVHFNDGLLSMKLALGDAEGMPLRASGTVRLQGGVRIALGITQRGTLEQAKELFAFSRQQQVSGPFATTVRVDGSPADIHVAGMVAASGAQYARVQLPDLRGAFYYSTGHLAVVALDLVSKQARLWSQADLDLTSSPLTVQGIVALIAPAQDIPVAANIVPGGVAQAIGAVTGPATNPTGLGYAQLVGQPGLRIRTIFGGGPAAVAIGPLLYEQGGGEGFLWARRDLSTNAWAGALYATRLPLHLRGGSFELADVLGPAVSLPSLDTTLDGAVFVLPTDTQGKPQPVAVNLAATSLAYQGVQLGTLDLTAAGSTSSMRIGRLSVDGPALTASGYGTVALGKSFAPSSAVLAGSVRADLGALAQAFPAMRLAGSGSGDFQAAYDGTHWMGGLRASSANASIAGVPIRGTSAFIDASPANTAVLASVAMPGGGVWAFGTLPSQRDPQGGVDAIVPDLDLAALAPLGLHGAGGRASGFATIAGVGDNTSIDAAAVLRGSYEHVPYAGDVDMRYLAGTLHSSGSRIALLRNQAVIDGAVSGLGAGPAHNPRLDLSVRIREGDLVALDRFTGTNAPVTGSYDADAQIGGVLRQPTVDARLDTDIGTLRGVAFNELHGALRVRPGDIQLTGGSVELGTSAFALEAHGTPQTFSVRASSPHVDMSDFNDFFGGRDVFAGTGDFDVAVSSLEHRLLASGDASLDDAALYDYRLGHIQTTFGSSRRGGLHATVTQSGPGGSTQLSGVVGFRAYHQSLPDFQTAVYRVRGHLRDLQLDEVLPFVHEEDLGLSGLLDADGTMHGTLQQPIGNATFQLHNGYLKRILIKNFSASVASDQNGVTLTDGMLELPFLSAQGTGRFGFQERSLDGTVTLQHADLAELGDSLRLPGSLSGQASGRVALSGTVKNPKAIADIDASDASIYDVAFHEAKLHAQYAPGEVSIGNTTLTFPKQGGSIAVTGTLPVQLRPLALGPKDKPVDFSILVRGMDLSVLDPLTRGLAALTGRLDAQASVNGTAGNPVGKGTATVADAGAQSPLETVALTGANAQLTFENDTITLKRLHATLGSGSIDVHGAAHVVPAAGLRSNAGLQVWSRIAFHGAQVNVPNWISGTLDGALSLTRPGSVPYVAGTIGVSNTSIPFAAIYAIAEGGAMKAPASGPVPGVPELLPGHTIVYGGGLWGPDTHTLTTIGQPTPAPTGLTLPSVDLDVGLNANNNVRIRGGSSIDLTTTGGITIGGNLQSPTLQGQFQTVRGQVGYFDTTFRVISGSVTFDPTSGLLPTLNATAVTNVSGAQITLTVSGRVDNLTTDLESNPSMSRDQIIATLLHAPQVAALTSANPQQTQATLAQTAQSYFNAQLSRSLLYPVESALAQELNIESISLIFNQYGALAVEVRTRFSNSVSAVYQSSVGTPITQAYGMSYRLQDYLALDVLQTSRPDYAQYSTVFNLRYTFQ